VQAYRESLTPQMKRAQKIAYVTYTVALMMISLGLISTFESLYYARVSARSPYPEDVFHDLYEPEWY